MPPNWRWRRQYHFRVAAGIKARLARRSDRPTKKGAGGLRWMTTPTMMLVRRGGGCGGRGRQRARRSAQKSRLKIRGIQICVVVRVGGGGSGCRRLAAAPSAHLWIDSSRFGCGAGLGALWLWLLPYVVRACARACARAFELVVLAHSLCPASSPVLRPSASAHMPWLMMAIVEAAGHTTAPTRQSSPGWAG